MATTFKTLRQYEKIGLIVLGVVVMIVFTVDPSIFSGGKGGRDNEIKGMTLVTWDGGSLTQGQIEEVMRDHRSVVEVEEAILQQIGKDKKNPGTTKVDPIRPVSRDGEIVDRCIFASYANAIGMTVDDEAVRTFLRKLGDDRLDMAEIKGILDETIGDSPEARKRFFSWMRKELASKAVERMILSGQSGVAPEAAWEQFKNFKQRAQIEYLELPTKKYMDQVKDKPSEAKLKELYDELKKKDQYVDIPDEGIRRPEKVGFGWVKADFETFVKEEMKKISDKDVADYYEKNKVKYKMPSKPPVKAPDTEEAPKPEAGKEEGKEGEKEAGKEEATPSQPKTEGGADKPADEPAKPESEKPESGKPDQPAEPAAEKPAAEKPAEPAPTETPKDSAEEISTTTFVSASFAQENPTQEPASQEPAQKPAEEKSASEGEKKPQDPPATEAKPNEGKKPEEKTVAEPATQEKPTEGEAPKAEEAKPVEEYRPLADVADMIRRDLASPAADKAYTAALKNAETELRALWKEVNLGEGKIDQKAVDAFDFEAFAAKHKLTFGKIELCSWDVAQSKEGLGKFPGFVSQAYFSDKSLLFEPRSITNPYGLSVESYVYWRTAQKDAFEPTFEESRADLEEASRYRKAKELAEKDAKEKAEEVKKAKKPLKEVFPKEPVLVTGQFSRGESRILEIPGADTLFINGVFDLQSQEAAALSVGDKSKFYVVYLSKYEFTNEDLKSEFAKFPIMAELAQAADSQSNATRFASYQEFKNALNVKYPAQEAAEESPE